MIGAEDARFREKDDCQSTNQKRKFVRLGSWYEIGVNLVVPKSRCTFLTIGIIHFERIVTNG